MNVGTISVAIALAGLLAYVFIGIKKGWIK